MMENSNTSAAYGTSQQGGALPRCPHCGKTVNPFLAWSIKSKGEFQCSGCGSYSNVQLAKSLYILGLLTVAVACVLLLIFFFTGCMNLWLLICMLIPFAAFTVISPFFVRLKKISPPSHPGNGSPAAKQARPAAQPPKTQVPPPTTGSRRYASEFSLDERDRKQDGK